MSGDRQVRTRHHQTSWVPRPRASHVGVRGPEYQQWKTVLEDDQENPPAGGAALWHVADKKVNGRDSIASLVDSYPGDDPGKFSTPPRKGRLPSIGSNAFEACLKFTYPVPAVGAAPAAGAALYYPGGSGGQGVPAMEPVIYSFFALSSGRALFPSASRGGLSQNRGNRQTLSERRQNHYSPDC